MVQFTPTTPADEAQEAWDFINGGGMPTLSFSVEDPIGSGDYRSLPQGTSYTGLLAAEPEKRAATDFVTKQPKLYPDGKQIYDLVLTLQTEYADPDNDEDDGKRRLFMSGNMRKALAAELREKGIKSFGLGTRVTVTLTGFSPNPKGGKPGKLFEVTIGDVKERVSPTVESVMSEAGYTEVAPAAAAPAAAAPAQAVASPDQMAAALALLNGGTPAPVITEEHTGKVATLTAANIDRATAIAAVASQVKPGDDAFLKALDAAIPF